MEEKEDKKGPEAICEKFSLEKSLRDNRDRETILICVKIERRSHSNSRLSVDIKKTQGSVLRKKGKFSIKVESIMNIFTAVAHFFICHLCSHAVAQEPCCSSGQLITSSVALAHSAVFYSLSRHRSLTLGISRNVCSMDFWKSASCITKLL